MTAAVQIALGSVASGEKFALFSLVIGDPKTFKRLLAPYGEHQRQGYLVPLSAALEACKALQTRSVELRAKNGIPETIKSAAWKCTVKGLYPYQRVGAEWLHARRRALLADQMGTGKAQPVSSLVLRIDGSWVPIGELCIGDRIIGSNGLPTRVIGVFPQGPKKVFELTFSDGAKARSTEDHLWAVRTPFMKWWGSAFTPKTLSEIRKRGLYKNKGRDKQWFIPVALPPEFPVQKFLVAPYLLGALIANAELGLSNVMHSGHAEQREQMRPYLPSGITFKPRQGNKWDFSLTKESGRLRSGKNSLLDSIRALNLAGTESYERFIPSEYFRGSVEQRKDLLQGLMDNDGCISKNGMVLEYNTTSPLLAEQVIYLVRSLGGIAQISTRIPKFTYLGKKKYGRRDHRIRMSLDFCPFRVSWKRERYVPRSKYPPVRAIVEVQAKRVEECVCIAVDAADSLYITNDFILTHNTPGALAAIDIKRGTLIVVPSVVLGNWYKEARRWRPDLQTRIWQRPYSLFPGPGEVNLVTYPQLPHEQLEARTRCPWCGKLSVVPLDDEEVAALRAQGKIWTDKCDPERGGQCKDAQGQARLRRLQQRADAWPERVWIGNKPNHPVQLIVDEAHYCKNKDSQRTIAVRTIATQCAAVHLLTGTPLLNSPPELWSLCQLFPGQGGQYDDGAWDTFGSWSEFVAMFEGKKNMVHGIQRGYEWKPGAATPEARERLSSVMLRRMRVDVLPDLPVKTRRIMDVEINERELSKLVTMTENELLQFQDWSDDEVLEQCAAGGALSTIRKELATLKLETFIGLIKEYESVEEPVIAFSYHRGPIEELGRRKGWTCITGSTSDSDRTAIVERFQRGELRGIAGTIGAMGVGVTLTRSANVMFLDRDFVPANNLQAEDRSLRIGQTRGVVVTILNATHPVDQRVAIILERKERLLEAMQLSEEPVLS